MTGERIYGNRLQIPHLPPIILVHPPPPLLICDGSLTRPMHLTRHGVATCHRPGGPYEGAPKLIRKTPFFSR